MRYWNKATKVMQPELNKLSFIFGFQDRNSFLKNNLKKYKAYPNWDMLEYINDSVNDNQTIVSLYNGVDYYVKPNINFIDSRLVGKEFFSTPFKNDKEILDSWKKINAKFLYINEDYLFSKDYETMYDFLIIKKPSFMKTHLHKVFSSSNQHLYKIKY